MKWFVLQDAECIHVLPESDSKPHGFPKAGIVELANTNCPCKPEMSFLGSHQVIVIHNSFYDQEKIGESMRKITIEQVPEQVVDKCP